jgi:Lanthionine synthetase C-like protein
VLFRPERFEPLTQERWDEERVRGAIRQIVASTDEAFDPVGLWPAEEWDAWGSPTPLPGLYCGAAGVAWALDALRRRGHAETRIDLAAATDRALECWREGPELSEAEDLPLPSASDAGLLSGETGILVVAWRVGAGAAVEDRLRARILESRASDANELMWGAPGGLLAARGMLGWTGGERWAETWTVVADAVWEARDDDGLWTYNLYGKTDRGLGPVHGLVGNAVALLGGGDLLPAERRERLVADTISILERSAVVENGLLNWPNGAPDDLRLQWCHGAPGIVASTANFLSEDLLVPAGELTWRAGPPGPEKGSSLCHGTAGNGYAFLKLYERTGDEMWLDRARRFAVHALEQVDRRGTGRYSLWSGDLGVAVYAADCIDARTAYPILDSWD